MKQKILSLLVLLLTAATGAWAQFSTASGEVSSKINTKRYAVKRGGIDNAYLQYSTEEFSDGVGTGGGAVWWGIRFPAADLAAYDGQILTQVGVFTASDGHNGYTYSGNYTVRVYQGGDTAPGTLVSEATEYLPGDMAWHDITLTTPVEIDATQDLWLTFYTPDIAYPMSGCTYVGNADSDFLSLDGSTWEHATGYGLDYTWMIRGVAAPAPGKVYLNADSTEATMEMPAYDVTVDYELVRDMSQQMTVSVMDAEQNSRFRVQKEGNVFVPVGMDNQAVMALFNVHDDIENADLTPVTDYTVQIFAVDDEDQPVGEAITFTNFTYAPGRYVVKAVAVDGTIYDGQTAASNIFQLFQGYEVTIPAGEYATFYKEENLYVEDADAELCTVTLLNDSKAVLSRMTIAKALTPMLVHNKNTEEAKTFLLISTSETADNVTPVDEFQGTLEATTIAASDASTNNYAFNGKQFVWVKNAVEIGANKAWLSINTGVPSARGITLVFDETTGLSEKVIVNSEEFATATWYDLNGRKLQNMPTKKGIYMNNGRKVVVK